MIRLTKRINRQYVEPYIQVSEVVSLAHIAAEPNWKFSLHSHNDYCELIYVADGIGSYIIENHKYMIGKGDIIGINRNTGHVLQSSIENPVDIWNLSLRVEDSPFGENMLLPNGYQPIINSGMFAETLHNIYIQLYQEMYDQSPHYEQMSLNLVDQLLIFWERIFAEQPKDISVGNNRKVTAKRIKEYIDAHYADKLTLEDLANRFFVSKYHIIHQMKATYHVAPIEYQISRRMGEAQNLLVTTNLSVTEIAGLVGYTDVHYFNRLFSQRFGMTPTYFRMKYMNIN